MYMFYISTINNKNSYDYLNQEFFELIFSTLSKNILYIEAGAQGEHKIARGFRPIRTFSTHKIKNPLFSKAILEFIEEEKIHVSTTIEKLCEYLPFKNLKK